MKVKIRKTPDAQNGKYVDATSRAPVYVPPKPGPTQASINMPTTLTPQQSMFQPTPIQPYSGLREDLSAWTAATSFFPHPAVSIPSKVINAGLGLWDAIEAAQAGNSPRAIIETISAVPASGNIAHELSGLAQDVYQATYKNGGNMKVKITQTPQMENGGKVRVRIKNTPNMENGGTVEVKISAIPQAADGLSSDKAREILRDGTVRGRPLTDKQKRFFGWRASQAEDGLEIGGNGNAEAISFNPYTGNTLQFSGPSHANGGIPIAYEGTPVEVEGDETAFVDNTGQMNIMGNMRIPGTKTKFKNKFKDIADREEKANQQMIKGLKLIDESDAFNRYQAPSFTTGTIKNEAARIKQKGYAAEKEALSQLQTSMLDLSANAGINPRDFSDSFRKFVNGGMIPKAAKGASLAQRHNNPGNLKFAKWMTKYGAVPGEVSKDPDKTRFAQFPSVEQGQQAMVALLKGTKYGPKSVREAIHTWTGGDPYKSIPKEIANMRVSDLNEGQFKTLLNTITMGEDSKKYNWEGVPDTPAKPIPTVAPDQPFRFHLQPAPVPTEPPKIYTTQELTGLPPATGTPTVPPATTPPTGKKPRSMVKGMPLTEILPEIATLFDQPEPVPHLTYEPTLFSPYQISLQDRLNENTSTFRQAAQVLGNNPEALAVLAADKYNKDNAVHAEQFRFNQEIQNRINNQNVQLLNQAELQNLQMMDTQAVRQAQAIANTDANKRAALTSLAGKFAQKRQEDITTKLYEGMSRYRQMPDGSWEVIGPAESFFPSATTATSTGKTVTTEIDPATGQPINIKQKETFDNKKKAAKQWGGRLIKKMKY